MTRRPTTTRLRRSLRPPGGRGSALLARLTVLSALLCACAPAAEPPGVPGAPPAEADARPLTPDEAAGEAVYRREGCGRCHTQFDAPPARGAVSLPGASDSGPLASRVGPDLGLEGHRRSDDWQQAHLYAPEILVPGSRMPASRHLFRPGGGAAPEPTEEARQLVAYLQGLGRQHRDVWAEFRSREPGIPEPSDVPASDRLERGDGLYRQHCAACHGAAGDGRGPAAGLLLFPPRDFTTAYYRFRSAPASGPPRDADLFRVITLGTGTGSAMPAFYFLSDEERWALVLRIKEFSPALRGAGLKAEGAAASPSPASAREGTDLARGKDLWDRLECATCHGPAGRGMTPREAGALWADAAGVAVPRSGDLTHACSRRGGGSEEAFARALIYGVGSAMPSFADDLGEPIGAARALIRHLEAGQGAGR